MIDTQLQHKIIMHEVYKDYNIHRWSLLKSKFYTSNACKFQTDQPKLKFLFSLQRCSTFDYGRDFINLY